MISTPVIICAIAFLGLAMKEKGKNKGCHNTYTTLHSKGKNNKKTMNREVDQYLMTL
jgi:hypothetical protein